MASGVSVVRLGGMIALVVALAACNPPVRRHGYVPAEADLAEIVVGEDTRLAVSDRIGRPSSSGLMQGGDWFYVGSTWKHVALRAPQEIDRQVVVIRFDDEGIVENVERFGLEDGKVVALSRRAHGSGTGGPVRTRQI